MLRYISILILSICSCLSLWGQEHQWNEPFFTHVDLGAGMLLDMQVDEAGNTYLIALFEDEVTILDTTLYTSKEDGVFLVKFDNDHNLLWVKVLAEANRDTPGFSRIINNVYIEIGDDFIYPVVEYKDSILLNNQLFTVIQTEYDYQDIAIFKYAYNGDLQNTHHIKGSCETGYGGIKIQDEYLYFHILNLRNNSHSAPTCTCSINSDTTIYSAKNEAILGRINQSDSTVDWVKVYKAGNGVTSVVAEEIAVNESSLYITGNVFGSDDLVMDEDSIIVNYIRYGYISRLDLKGNHKWTKYFGVNSWDSSVIPKDIEINTDDDIVMIGNVRTQSEMNRVFFHDGSYLTGSQNNDESFFVVNYDSLGNIKWKDISNSIGYESSRSIALDRDKNIYLTGTFTSSLVFDPLQPALNASGDDILVASYDSLGNKRWAQKAGGGVSAIGSDIRIDSLGYIHVAGSVNGSSATFGAYQTTPPSGGNSIFVAQMRLEPIGLEETTPQQFGVSLYPNPSLGNTHVEIQDEFISQIRVYNGLGQEIQTLNFENQTNQASIENLVSGYYIIDIHSLSGKRVSQKLIVQ